MTPAEVVECVTSWARLDRTEVCLWCETQGEWTLPNGRVTLLRIIGPDWVPMELPIGKLTLMDLGRVLDALGACALWSPDALETGTWVLAKLKRWLAFTGCTRTFSHLLQEQPPNRWLPDVVDDYQKRRLALLDAKQQAVIGLEMGVLRAMIKATVEGYEQTTTKTVIYPEWTLVHPSGNPLPLAHHPPVNSWMKPQKATLGAPDGFRWMQIRYPLLEARVLAAQAGERAAFRYLGETHTMSDESERSVIAFMRQGVTMEAEVVNSSPAGYYLSQLQVHLKDVVATAEATGVVSSLLGRRWRWQENPRAADPHEARRIAAAYVGHSGATALKIGLVKLSQAAEEQPLRMFLNFRQLLPHFDSLNYLIDERVPHDRHCESLLSMMQLPIATKDGIWTLDPEISVGSNLTQLVPWNDPQALTTIALAREGSFTLKCPECGLTTNSQRVLDTHLLEEHV